MIGRKINAQRATWHQPDLKVKSLKFKAKNNASNGNCWQRRERLWNGLDDEQLLGLLNGLEVAVELVGIF